MQEMRSLSHAWGQRVLAGTQRMKLLGFFIPVLIKSGQYRRVLLLAEGPFRHSCSGYDERSTKSSLQFFTLLWTITTAIKTFDPLYPLFPLLRIWGCMGQAKDWVANFITTFYLLAIAHPSKMDQNLKKRTDVNYKINNGWIPFLVTPTNMPVITYIYD